MQPNPAQKRLEGILPGMFNRFFRSRRNANRLIAEAAYDQIVAAARQPALYARWQVPDTPLGRYEMLALHLFLLMHRLRGEGGAADALGQELADTFFGDVDHSLRELGIGDMGIPKRMKKLARMFFGRAASYGEAIDAGDRPALAAALKRNVAPQIDEWREAGNLADYAFLAKQGLEEQQLADLLAGRITFPIAFEDGEASK